MEQIQPIQPTPPDATRLSLDELNNLKSADKADPHFGIIDLSELTVLVAFSIKERNNLLPQSDVSMVRK